jgi:hypothetical protein
MAWCLVVDNLLVLGDGLLWPGGFGISTRELWQCRCGNSPCWSRMMVFVVFTAQVQVQELSSWQWRDEVIDEITSRPNHADF